MNTKTILILLALFVFASPIFAADAAPAGSYWVSIGAYLAMAIASGLCALGQGKAVAGAAEALARNPAASAAIRFALLLGLILIESLALYTFAVIFVK